MLEFDQLSVDGDKPQLCLHAGECLVEVNRFGDVVDCSNAQILRFFPSLELLAVMKITGIERVSSCDCSFRHTSSPSISGIMTSSRIKSGR